MKTKDIIAQGAISILLVAIAGLCLWYLLPHAEPGTFELYITDKPITLDAVSSLDITVSDIQVHRADTDEWISVVDDERQYDLMELIGKKMLIRKMDLPAGNYTQIRLFVSDASMVINSGEVDLKIPSGNVKQRGILPLPCPP